MNDPLAPLLADGVIDEVVSRLKSGKEADVWLVRHGDEVVAAKVYKARHVRSFRNDAAYREGRQVRNTRTQRAMDRGSRFGQAAAEDAWKAKESDALHRLHAAGVRVPRPVLFFEGVLLMEVVVDAEGRPAPRLVDAQIPPERAAALYADLRAQAVGMLASDLIHGDLSPYNILVGANGPVIIDFPQVVGAAHNSQAEAFFLRDLHNVHRFFAALDPALRASEGDGREIWRAYVRRELTPDFVPTGRAPEPRPQRRPDDRGRRDAGGPQGHGRQQAQHAPPRQQHGQGRAPQPGQGRPAQHAAPPQQHGQGRPPQQGQGPPAQHAAPPQQHGQGRPPQPGQGRPPPHGQDRPPRQRQGQGQGRPAQPGPRRDRHGSAPEVVRVVRLDRAPPAAPPAGGPPHGSAPHPAPHGGTPQGSSPGAGTVPRGGDPGQGTGSGGRWRRRRHR